MQNSRIYEDRPQDALNSHFDAFGQELPREDPRLLSLRESSIGDSIEEARLMYIIKMLASGSITVME